MLQQKKPFLVTPELLQNKKERERKSVGVVFSEETGEVLRIIRADNDVRMFFGASLQEKERLVKLTQRDFEEANDETFKNTMVEKIKNLIMKNKLDYKSLSFDEYYTWMLKNSTVKYLVG